MVREEFMMNEKLKNIGIIAAGNLLLACGVNAFVMPGQLIATGSTGFALVLSGIIPLSMDQIVILISLTCFLAGAIVLKREFAAKTFLSAVLYPILFRMTGFLENCFLNCPSWLAAIGGGALMGAGLGLILKAKASSGGMDIPPIILERKLHIPASITLLGMDLLFMTCQIMQNPKADLAGGLLFLASTYSVLTVVRSEGRLAPKLDRKVLAQSSKS